MNEALGWIGELVGWFARFIPKWEIVNTTQGMVKFIWGERIKVLGPGWHAYWPLSTEAQIYPTALQTVDLRGQRLETADGKTIAVSGMLAYTVDDLGKLLSATHDPDEVIQNLTLGAIASVLMSLPWAEIKAMRVSTRLGTKLKHKTNSMLEPYGVVVAQVTLLDLVPTEVLTLLHGGESRTAIEKSLPV